MIEDIAIKVRQQWNKANCKFQPPVTTEDNAIAKRMTGLWEKANKIARRQVSKQEVSKSEQQLDKLFDIT